MDSHDPVVPSLSNAQSASQGNRVIPVILSGGSGSRLWPVSRESFPKQYWPLVSGRSLIQDVALRAVAEGCDDPILVCNQEHRFLVAEMMRTCGIEGARVVLEPMGRNSAPAITAAALLVAEDNPDTVMWMMAADAAMQKVSALHSALQSAVFAARAGRIVTFGMMPTCAEVGYGYLEVGDKLEELVGVHEVLRFIEKPDLPTAEALFASGRHLWNSGMFVFTAAVLIAEMEKYAPAVVAAMRNAVENRRIDRDFIRLAPDAFASSPDISLDYAVAERTKLTAVVPADLGWSDVGSWNALWELGEKDDAGNVAIGDVLLEGASHCYARSDGMVTAVVGLQDAVIVVTKDAVLAMHRDQAQKVKLVVDRLRKAGRHEAVAHNRVYRPWGFYESLIQGDRFQVKRIVVSPGHQLSLQKHFHRAEHWVVVNGSALVNRDSDEILVRENESIYMPLGCVHRLTNPGRIPLTLIEVQSGSYLGEDDIVRYDDVYGRM